jgi:hypothetical protein
VYGYDAASMVRKAELKIMHHKNVKATITACNANSKKNIHLNKRFQKESVEIPTIATLPFQQGFVVNTYYSFYTRRSLSAFKGSEKSLRGPPTC